MKFQANFYVLALLLTTTLATLTDVKNDIQTITGQVQLIDNVLTKFSNIGGSTITAAAALHGMVVSLGQSIDKGTMDTKALSGPVSESDAQPILEAFEELKIPILDILTKVVAQQVVVANLVGPIGGTVVLQDLNSISSSTSQFEIALISFTPADLLAQASSVTSSINAAFATAVAVYS